MKTPKHIVLLLMAALALGISCSDFTELEFEEALRSFAVPLFESESTFEDFFQSSQNATSVFIDEDNVATIRYEARPVLRYAADVIDPIDLNIPIALPTNPTVLPLPLPGEVILERAVLSGEELFLTFSSDEEEDVFLEFYITELSLEGETLMIKDTLVYEGTSPTVGSIESFDLAGYTLSIPDGTIEIGYTAKTASGADVELASVVFLISKRLDFTYLEGIWSNNRFEGGRDTIVIDLYDQFLSGNLEILDPRIIAKFTNSFGVPVRGELPLFQVVTVDDEELAITSPILDAGIDFPFPDLTEEYTDIKDTTIIFDMSNSNLVDVFNAKAKRVEYALDLNVNPDDLPDVRGWIADSSVLGIVVGVEIPVKGTADQFAAMTVFDVDITSLDPNPEPGEVATRPRKIELHLYSENEMPIGITGQIFVSRFGGTQLNTELLPAGSLIVEAAPVDGSGNVTGVATNKLIIELEGAQLTAFYEAQELTIFANFSTSNNASVPVSISGDQVLKTNLSALITEAN